MGGFAAIAALGVLAGLGDLSPRSHFRDLEWDPTEGSDPLGQL